VGKDKNIAIKIGIRIKTLRKNRGITQEKLSELSGLDYKHIQLLESKNPPNLRIDSLNNIASAFGLNLVEFFSDEMFQEKSVEIKKKKFSIRAKSPLNRKIIFENQYWYSIFHHPPVSRGHIVIYSKRGINSYFDILQEEINALDEMKRKVIHFLLIEFNPNGFHIGMDLGECAGQEFDNLAVHIIPRYIGDSRNPLQTGMKKVLGI
jgi:diadenosine tetraphosphate (Ap4A) HIT family hydrolase/DNA-binding Xre family transcriptional regulator